MTALLEKMRAPGGQAQAIDHPAMGRLRRTAGVFQGRVESENGVIGVSVNPDGQAAETALALAEKVIDNIDALSEKARELVAANALEAYNADWRFGERPVEAGIMVMFEAPMKSKAEFCDCLRLLMVRITGRGLITLTFALREMFSTHIVNITSMDGLGFNDVRVDLQDPDPEMLRDVPSWWYPMSLHPDAVPQPCRLTRFQRALKRSVDIVGALAFFVFLGPLYLLVAAAVFIAMGGPVHYGQTRLGQGGQPFRCYKFRSMLKESDETLLRHLAQDAAARARWDRFQKLEDDPRITRVGRAIRRLSLDELPQFFNVLRGDMSLVGPRPCMVRQRSLYGNSWSHYCHMRPGITGLWQVSGRNHLPYADRVALDARFAAQWSLRLDAQILARTFRVVLSGDGSS
ncbi:sugar transferase [Variovorax saccharolyticus]|uniref:sugar transferase n=1 Tax=Variovorax saccharolyticus TaxID=3053516 RepID=UPI0025784BA6|nr:sugar transferase [Variovorax sp. J31P216]MDM0026360.1 sugar transferase [Variovorax sp. J31P216]